MSDLVVMTRKDLDYLVGRLGGALAESPEAPIVTILDVEQVGEPRLVEAYDVAVTLTTLEEVEDDCDCPGCLRFPWELEPDTDPLGTSPLSEYIKRLSWCDCE